MVPRLASFGVFEFDLETGDLFSKGHRIRLQEQPRQVLRMLVGQPGELVTRQALQTILWPGDTFVDFDAGLNVIVNKLRQVLGDSAASPRFIETLPKRGYRFIAPVTLVCKDDPSREQRLATARHNDLKHVQPPIPRTAPWPGVRLMMVALGTLVLVAAIGASATIYFSRGGISEAVLRPLPLTSLPGLEFAPAISPDGSQVAFLWDGGQETPSLDVYVQAVGDASPVKLASGFARQPIWSPDAKRITFLRYTDRPGASRLQEVVEVPATGGVERRLAVVNAEQFGLSWSPDGRSLAIVDKAAQGSADAIHVLSIRDGSKHQLTSPPVDSVGDCLPRFSPDGRWLAFVRVRPRYFADVYVMDLRTKGLTRVTHDEENILGAPDWMPDSRELIYSSAQRHLGGLAHLWKVTPDGRRRQRLGDGFEPSLSRGAKPVLAYVRIHVDWNVWRLPGPLAPASAAPERVIESTQIDANPQYSPDGEKIAYISNRSGMYELWISQANGANAARLTFLDTNDLGMTASWSSDNESLTFSAAVDGNADVYVISAKGGLPKRVMRTVENERFPSFSHDGQWIYFSSRKSGSDQVWRIPREGGKAVQVTRNGGIDAHESSDGRFLYFTKALFQVGEQGIWRQPIAGGPEEKIADAGQAMQWALIEQGPCYVKSSRGERAFVECVDIGGGSISWSAPLDAPAHSWGSLSLSSDGQWILMDRRDRQDGDLVRAEGL